MKKILAIVCISLFVISIIASVSEDLTRRVQKMTGGNAYSAAMVPVPKQPVKQDNLAVSNENLEIPNAK